MDLFLWSFQQNARDTQMTTRVTEDARRERRSHSPILGDPGADSGGEGKFKRAEKCGMKKSKERREEPLGTMSCQTRSKRSPPFWLLIVPENLYFSFRPFRLSLAPTICPWVSEDGTPLTRYKINLRWKK